MDFQCNRRFATVIIIGIPLRKAVMSPRKLCFFTMLVAIVGFAALGRLDPRIRDLTLTSPNMRPHDLTLAAEGSLWYEGEPTNELDPSRQGKASPAQGEMLPT